VPEYYSPASIPWIKSGDLKDALIESWDESISESGLANSAAKIWPTGTVLMAMYGLGTAGRLGLVGEPAACNQAICAMVANPAVCDARWLFYMLKGDRDRIEQSTNGAVQQNISAAAIRQYTYLTPPLPEQQAIAEVLGALDDKIAANTALAATVDLYASTLLLGSLSTDRVRLDSIAGITMGSSPKGETLNELGEGVPFYQGVRDYGFRSPTRRVFTTSPVRSADAGDILVSVRAPVGDVNVADEPLCIGRGIAAVRSTIATQATLFHQLKAERDAWEPYEAEGTVFGSINRDQLHGIRLRPVTPERADFVEQKLAAMESSIAATLAENRTLAATRDALLPQLMSGKLRVRDAARITREAGV
jgi:type I restriction enzyme S subunit